MPDGIMLRETGRAALLGSGIKQSIGVFGESPSPTAVRGTRVGAGRARETL